jgi:DNA polymerase-3 subunit alpha
LLARAVVRDSGRVLGFSYGQVDRLAKLVPERPIGIKLEQALAAGSELANHVEADEGAKRIIEVAREHQAGMIALAGKSGGFSAALLGSIARDIVRGAHCPVWVLHEKEVT